MGRLTLTRLIESYAFDVIDRGKDHAYVEIGPDQARRLVDNLTIALKINGHWKSDDLTIALTRIAAFDDTGANERLARDGSYASFDEPSSVQIAREALIKAGIR